MKNNVHGIFSISLFGAAIAIGLVQVLRYSTSMALVYLAVILISGPVMMYAYCAKCDCRLEGCRHGFIGKLTRFFPERENKPYTIWDNMGIAIPMAALLGFPQYWLWKTPMVWIVFSVLPILAGIEILLFVCKGCENHKCQICVQRNQLTS